MPSRPSSPTPSGSPIAPIAVVSSPGRTTTCTPVVARRSLTASTSTSVAPGVMTIITAWSEAEALHAQLVEADVMSELVPDRPDDLVAQEVGVVAEVAAQR